jgi:phosphoribosylaminoimidazole carboxylase/phosphoribosylaminoimidazole-succinocarboxamide synthase
MPTKEMLAEGKTKIILSSDEPGCVLVQSKDSITAGDGAKRDEIVNKGVHANLTTSHVFSFLNRCGIESHFIKMLDDRTFLAKQCDMIPLEVVARRMAFGSYLKRHPGTPDKWRFNPPLVEIFLKDDARHDPFMEPFTVLHEKITSRNGKPLSMEYLEKMQKQCRLIFEILEKAWADQEVALVDLKVEFGFDLKGNLILSDVIDNDSWRIWPHGEKSQMKDKQVYRDLPKSSLEALQAIEANYREVALMTEKFASHVKGKVEILLGSKSDEPFISPMVKMLSQLEIPHDITVSSVHKTTSKLFDKIRKSEGLGEPIVFIAAAGRSNGLGPVTEGNTAYPVINCPVLSERFAREEIFSSLYLPSGLGCVTILDPEAAALAAAKILALHSPLLFGKIKVLKYRMSES